MDPSLMNSFGPHLSFLRWHTSFKKGKNITMPSLRFKIPHTKEEGRESRALVKTTEEGSFFLVKHGYCMDF